MTPTTKPTDSKRTRKLIQQIVARLKYLDPGRHYQLETIVGPEFWEQEEDSHKGLGHDFSKLVRDNRVPFVRAEKLSSDRHNLYVYTG